MAEMTNEDKKGLIAKLEEESENIMGEFVNLYVNATNCLKKLNVTVDQMKLFFEGFGLIELVDSIKCDDTIEEIIRKTIRGSHWSFFNYKLLDLIINVFCKNEAVHADLQAYILKFEKFCRRRLYEIPTDVLNCCAESSIAPKSIICVKLDKNFNVPLIQLDRIRKRIEQLLNIQCLNLIDIKEGCVELQFRHYMEYKEIFPVSKKQTVIELQEIGVIWLKCDSYNLLVQGK